MVRLADEALDARKLGAGIVVALLNNLLHDLDVQISTATKLRRNHINGSTRKLLARALGDKALSLLEEGRALRLCGVRKLTFN